MADNALHHIWAPITGMPKHAGQWGSADYTRLLAEWRELRGRLEDPALDKKIIEIWSAEHRRRFALETGQVENLYAIPRGITEQLITGGFEASLLSHVPVAPHIEKDKLADLLADQEEALQLVFDNIKGERAIASHTTIQEWHQLLTRWQATAPGRDQLGRAHAIPLRKGEYKKSPNNPRTAQGVVHQYCPPEQVRAELDRLFEMYPVICKQNYPTEVEAAWLHHRYIQIHPFQDGNGRTARLLVAAAYIRRGEFPPVIGVRHRPRYFRALASADTGNLRPFADFLSALAIDAIGNAISAAQNVLEEGGCYHHSNGENSVKDSVSGMWVRQPAERDWMAY